MQDDKFDLDELSLVWKSDNPPAPETFRQRIETRRLRMIALSALETLIGIAGLAVAIYLLINGSAILGLAVLVYSLGSLGIAYWSRSGAWSVSTGSVKAELQTSIRQARAQYRWGWGGIWICGLALIFLAVMAYLTSISEDLAQAEFAETLQFFAGAFIFIAINLIITSVVLENSRKKLFNLSRLYEQFQRAR